LKIGFTRKDREGILNKKKSCKSNQSYKSCLDKERASKLIMGYELLKNLLP